MLPEISKIKGIHPGVILKREIRKRGIKNAQLAASLQIHAQTIGAILKEKRGINPQLSIKLGQAFNIEKDYFSQLQVCFEVKKIDEKLKNLRHPDFAIITEKLFWDTDVKAIDWEKNKRAIIKRIFEHGNEGEIKEIISFYSSEVVADELKQIKSGFFPAFAHNVSTYFPAL